MYSLRHLHSPQLKINAPGCITVGKQTWNVNHHQNLKKAHGHFFCHFKKKHGYLVMLTHKFPHQNIVVFHNRVFFYRKIMGTQSQR